MLTLLRQQTSQSSVQTSTAIRRQHVPGYLMVSSARRFASKVAVASLICVVTIALDMRAPVLAQDTVIDRPRIGLALSGGGARGASHLGVLRVLERERIPIDYIAGTSMGSIVGGMYASGMSPEEIEAQLVAVDWDDVFADKVDREIRSYRRKTDDRLWLIDRKLGFNDGKVDFPAGLVQGQKINQLLIALTLPVADIDDFDDLAHGGREVTNRTVSRIFWKAQP